MGRELQKKKNRSSLNRVKRKPKSKKKHFGNPIIAANWDKSLTLSQNYKKLGLAVGLNRPTGGTEKTIQILKAQEEQDAAKSKNSKLSINPKLPSTMAIREARVERDPETGEILRVIEDEGLVRDNPLHDLLNEFDEEDDQDGGEEDETTNEDSSVGRTEVVRQLESIAAAGESKKPRHQSAREIEWVEALVQRHGDDYDKMFMDRKLNPMQQSAGQIKKRVLQWRKSTAS
ncbi:hypothetical protein NA57DRAFT_63525 [Rhizodiscina lignyota]|uniref:Nucleolar protein 16 n=1 Tax=Rhizodiscina lignyota TaxID=1504668 RepID=A0A9P4M9Y9_9PEZI|nr:hypothetical protein NA57DRAFT_63525 [Rhizodiscina lignyota]